MHAPVIAVRIRDQVALNMNDIHVDDIYRYVQPMPCRSFSTRFNENLSSEIILQGFIKFIR